MEVRKRGMDTIPRYPRRAAGDFANSTWPEAKMRYTHTRYFSLKEHSYSLQYQTLHGEGQTDLLRWSSPVQLYKLVQQRGSTVDTPLWILLSDHSQVGGHHLRKRGQIWGDGGGGRGGGVRRREKGVTQLS